MAGTGPAPKLPGQRVNRTPPSRGEWIELDRELERPVLPPYRSDWRVWVSAKTPAGDTIRVKKGVSHSMWNAWRSDPLTAQYGPADIAAICYLAEHFHALGDSSRLALMDRLGLTPRGRRDLRWRTPQEAKTHAEQAPVKRLRLSA